MFTTGILVAWSIYIVAGQSGQLRVADEQAAQQPTAQQADQLRDALRAFLDGKLPAEQLTITYTDARGLQGTATLVIHGDGRCEQTLVNRQLPKPRDLQAKDVRQLVELLLSLEAWQQRTPEAPLVPDEARVTLRITAGQQQSSVWERDREMPANNRLIQVGKWIEQATRDAPQPSR